MSGDASSEDPSFALRTSAQPQLFVVHCRTCRCEAKSCWPLLCCCSGRDDKTLVKCIIMEDSKKGGSSRWLGGAPSAAKNPFRREKSDLSGLKKSVSSSAVTLKKSVSVSSLGKSLRRAASKLSLGSREKSGSSLSVNKVLPIQPVNDDQRSRSTHSVGSLEIGEAVRTRFVWDHGGTIVYVCVMQNGIKKSYRLLKENEGHHAANATLWAGRCEFR